MTIKKKIFTAVCSALAVQTAFAVCFAEIEFRPENGGYSLVGTNEACDGNYLSVIVEHSDGTATVTDHASYAVIDRNGNFNYRFALKPDAVSADYTVKVSAPNKGIIFTTPFSHADENKKAEIIKYLNGEKMPADALSEAVKYSMVSYPENRRDTFPPSWTEDYKKLVYSQISEHGFTETNYALKINQIYAVTELAFANGENISEIITRNIDYLGFKDFSDYYRRYTENTSGINALILKNELKNILDTQRVFKEVTVLNEINKASSPSAIVTVIDNNSGLFDKSVTDLDGNSKISLAGKILDAREKGTILTKMSEVKSYIPSEDGKTPGGSTTPSKGSSSSGSGTSGSKMTVVPGGNITDEKDKLMSFADINEAKWAREAIESLVAKNVIKGYEDGDFKPNANITREEFVKIVVGAFGVEVTDGESVFDDVSNDSWAKDYITAAKNAKIINGISENIFGLGRNITREDMAVMLVNAYEAKIRAINDGMHAFADDAQIADYAKSAVAKLYGAGVISGYEDGTFLPKNNATRAEAAQMVYKILKIGE